MSRELKELKQELVDQIGSIEEIQTYVKIKEQMEEHGLIREYTKRIKSLHKQIINARHIGKEEQVKLLEHSLRETTDALESLPIYQQFLQSSEETQLILNDISDLITEYFNK